VSFSPSGRQVTLHHGLWSATVVEVGGGLREVSHDGIPLLDGYGADEMASGGRGQPLIPWPNRLADATYRFEGRELRAPISEPSTGSANHGLTRWLNWTVADAAADRCAMQLRLHPQPAYPFVLDLRLEYALSDAGLEVTMSATNAGPGDLPFGAGFHPFLTAGTALIDDACLTVRAASWLPTDARAIPTGEHRPVEGEFDLRVGPQVGDRALDHCFTDLARDADGTARVDLEGPSGRVTLWMDPFWSHVMVFTGDSLAPERRRRGLAVEPMSCAPNAFNTGEGLRVLAPGESVRGRWGLERHGAA
jgi:aldose 1-epimerase